MVLGDERQISVRSFMFNFLRKRSADAQGEDTQESYAQVVENTDEAVVVSETSDMGMEAEPEVASGSTNLDLFKYIRWIVYAMVFLVPLFFLPWTSEFLEFNKQFLIFILAGIGLILYLAQVVKSGHLVFKKSLANYAVLISVGAVVLVSLFSDLRWQSIFGRLGGGYESLLTTVSFGVFFFLVFNVFKRDDVERLVEVFAGSLFVALLISFLDLLGLPVFKLIFRNTAVVGSKAFNTVGTMNALGIMAAVLLSLSFAKIRKGEESGEEEKLFDLKNWWSYLRVPALFLSLFFLVLLNWWIVWIVAISGLVFVVISNSWLGKWKMSSYFWPTAIIILAVVFMLFNFNLTAGLNKNLPVEIAPSYRTSLSIAKQSLFSDPLFGVGPENFSLAYDLYRPESVNNSIFWNISFANSASELFNLITNGGVVGLLGFLVLLGMGFYLGLRKRENGEFLRRRAILMPLYAVLIAAFVLYPFNVTLGFSLWFLFSMIVLANSRDEDEVVISLEKSPKHSLITSLLFVGVLVLAIVGFYYVILRYQANVNFARAMTENNADKRVSLLVNSTNIDKGEDLYPRALADFLVLRVGQEINNLNNAKTNKEKQTIAGRIQNFSATAINVGKSTTDRHPNNPVNWFARGLVYERLFNVIDGSDDWAVKMYEEYTKVSPKDPRAYLRIGNVYMIKADSLRQILIQGASRLKPDDVSKMQNQIQESLTKAEEAYKKAIELKSNYVLAIYNLGVVYDRLGRVKDAIKQLEATRAVNPLDANLALQLGLLYYRDNQKDNALREFQRAIAIFPNFSNARWYLALLYEERGELDKALAQLKEVEKLNPDNQLVKARIARLEEGKRSREKLSEVKPLEVKPEEAKKIGK